MKVETQQKEHCLVTIQAANLIASCQYMTSHSSSHLGRFDSPFNSPVVLGLVSMPSAS